MAYKLGESGNPTGRPKGAKNRVPNKLREDIVAFLGEEFATVKKDFKELDPRDRLKFYTDLLQYGIPKLQATSMAINFEDLTDEQLDEIIERIKNGNQ